MLPKYNVMKYYVLFMYIRDEEGNLVFTLCQETDKNQQCLCTEGGKSCKRSFLLSLLSNETGSHFPIGY